MSKLLARLAALVGLALALAACQPLDPTTSGNANVNGEPVPQAFLAMACVVDVHAPVAVKVGHGVQINATAVLDCGRMATAMVTHVTLERQDSPAGPWWAVETTSKDEIPYSRHPVTTTLTTACFDGHYRTRVLITGHAIGRDFSYSVAQTPDAVIGCETDTAPPPVNPV